MKTRFRGLFILLFSFSLAVSAFAAPVQDGGYVTDGADALSPATERTITELNNEIAAATGGAIVVVTDSYLPDGWDYADEYANYLFDKLGVGSAKQNNGLLLYFTTEDSRVWLATGVGMEYTFDAESYLEDYFYGEFDRGNFDAATLTLVNALSRLYITAASAPPPGNNYYPEPANNYDGSGYYGSRVDMADWFVSRVITFIIIVLIIFLLVASSRRKRYVRYNPGFRPGMWAFFPGFYRHGGYYQPPRRRGPPPPPPPGGFGRRGPPPPGGFINMGGNRPSSGAGRSSGSRPSSGFGSSGFGSGNSGFGGGRSSGGGAGRAGGFSGGGSRPSGGGGSRPSGGGGRSSGGGAGRR
ncbi:MAG: TPM domain-containing protein [Oscillospiraceae bacterium]|nr:TPM domain-containing protein [Oscillospiraceae bacterium]